VWCSINAVNLAKKSATIPEISNFSQGIIFLARPVHTLYRPTYSESDNALLSEWLIVFQDGPGRYLGFDPTGNGADPPSPKTPP